MSAKSAVVDHSGFKYLHLVLTLVLMFFWTLFSFFTWLTGIEPVALMNFALGFVGLFMYLLFTFFWQILKHYMDKVFKKFVPEGWTDLGFKDLILVITLILGVMWALFNFFSWLPTGVTATSLYTFGLGLTAITLVVLFGFLVEIVWAFFHKVSDT